ncbi:MAG TPA: aminotransferase class V-fold PLP-dependent enzyme [Burkholderiales bacterium]|nr:aminotransferase class V-fold PLP-dependent enzyme [Burkholderiales bacterium]
MKAAVVGNAFRTNPETGAGREEFPVTEKYVYFDHAGVGPLTRCALSAMTGSLRSQAHNGSLDHPRLHEIAEEARAQFAGLIGAESRQIGYVPSTSAGISLIARGLRLRPGDEVVAPAVDFPSAVLPWLLLEKEGVTVRRVDAERGQLTSQTLIDAISPRTRVISTSWIQFSSGARLDLQHLGEACRKKDVLLVVDGMQGVGAARIDVSALPIDALVTQSYKWLLGPQGIGWLYMSDRLSAMTELTGAGVRTGPPRESYCDHRLEPRADVGRFETGILDFHAIVGAMTSQRLLLDIGIEKIESRLIELGDRLRHGLAGAACQVLGGGASTGLRSSIVSFRHPRKNAQEVCDALLRANVVTSVRENHVRVSPHFYNTDQEVDQFLRLLAG